MEEQQLHLNVGLNKIAETVEQVEEMQKSLAVKSQELQAKNEAANAKLKQMFKDQQEAEKKKIQSQEIQVQLADQTVKIDEKRKFVMADLALVEPAVLDAQQGTVFWFPIIHLPSDMRLSTNGAPTSHISLHRELHIVISSMKSSQVYIHTKPKYIVPYWANI